MKTVLLIGFEPFGGESANPSQDVARRLEGERIAGHRVAGVVLPVVFGTAIRELRRHLRATQPRVVLCLGLAGDRAGITLERVALNLDDARIPDNAGQRPVDVPIVRRGPTALWATLPVKAILEVLADRGIPAGLSHSAGAFVCNHVFYGLMHAVRRMPPPRPLGGFVHLPYRTGQGPEGRPHLPFDTLVAAVRAVIEVSVQGAGQARPAALG